MVQVRQTVVWAGGGQIQASFSHCWFYRYTECKWRGRRARTQTFKDVSEGETMHSRARLSEGDWWRVKLQQWILNGSGDPRKLEMLGMWTICQAKPGALNGLSGREGGLCAANGQAVWVARTSGAHISRLCALIPAMKLQMLILLWSNFSLFI